MVRFVDEKGNPHGKDRKTCIKFSKKSNQRMFLASDNAVKSIYL